MHSLLRIQKKKPSGNKTMQPSVSKEKQTKAIRALILWLRISIPVQFLLGLCTLIFWLLNDVELSLLCYATLGALQVAHTAVCQISRYLLPKYAHIGYLCIVLLMLFVPLMGLFFLLFSSMVVAVIYFITMLFDVKRLKIQISHNPSV
ncbi:MAG: hypothetical protein JNL57_06570 [Bacteroidetes bacterium]|nr:hypothetical protein [Bacteroidota bacterium]